MQNVWCTSHRGVGSSQELIACELSNWQLWQCLLALIVRIFQKTFFLLHFERRKDITDDKERGVSSLMHFFVHSPLAKMHWVHFNPSDILMKFVIITGEFILTHLTYLRNIFSNNPMKYFQLTDKLNKFVIITNHQSDPARCVWIVWKHCAFLSQLCSIQVHYVQCGECIYVGVKCVEWLQFIKLEHNQLLWPP